MTGPSSTRRRQIVAIVIACWAIATALLTPAGTMAASPLPTPEGGGDTRSVGEGPGLVGEPVLAVIGVLGLGVLAAALTLVYVRATGVPKQPIDVPRPPTTGPGSQLAAGSTPAPAPTQAVHGDDAPSG